MQITEIRLRLGLCCQPVHDGIPRRRRRRTAENPQRLGGAGHQLGFDLAGEEGPRQAFRPILRDGGGAFCRHAADDHGARQRSSSRSPISPIRRSASPSQNAGLDDLRIIGDEFQDGVPGYYSQEYMVLKDGPIQKVEDLKGKVVATNAAGSAVDVAMKAMLHKHGLEPNRDYTVVEAPFPAMKAMLAEKKVDLDPGRAAVLLRSRAAKNRAAICSYSTTPSASPTWWCGPRASRSSTRTAPRWWISGGYAAHHALVPRSEEPRGGDADPGDLTKRPPADVRLGVHQAGLLSRSRYAAEPRRAAEERRHDQGSRLHQGEL